MDFKLIDSGDFYKLEKVGPYVYHRPSPAAVWPSDKQEPFYDQIDATYERHQNGKGKWIYHNKNMDESYPIKVLDLNIEIQRTSFGHLGIFAEQIVNWKRLKNRVSPGDRVLNLFAYTGIASLICASCDAEVAHVDASKTSVDWAKKNQKLSKLEDKKIRWLVDDVQKFVSKEIRRQNHYEWIILDPPSFGRGKNKEVWQIEEHLNPLLKNLSKLKSKNFKGILLSSHSPGYSPLSLDNLLKANGFSEKFKIFEEMVVEHPEKPLASGACSWRTNIKL